MGRTVFISYNHKDQDYALKIRDILAEKGWEVLIDVDRMKVGQNIDQFIIDCIRQSDFTLMLISANSLLSAWVAVETAATIMDEKIRNRFLIPCYIDDSFFDRSFVAKSMAAIEEHLQEIGGLITTAIEKGWGIEDLQNQRTRYLRMKNDLAATVGKLRDMLGINLAGDHFEAGIQKVLNDLEQLKVPFEDKTRSFNEFDELVGVILNEENKQRLLSLKTRLSQLNLLLDQFEEKLMLSANPLESMRCNKQIEILTQSIQKVTAEIRSFQN